MADWVHQFFISLGYIQAENTDFIGRRIERQENMMIGGFSRMGMVHGPGMIIGALVGLVVLVGLIWLVVWAIRRGSKGGAAVAPAASAAAALDIARERYAKGEIDREKYLQIIADLKL
jgi:uncharacterized membrane protein